MALNYEKSVKNIIKRLEVAHDPSQAKIRCDFFKTEFNFFRKYIKNQRVLVAGSGLGHDCFELAKYNKKVIGVELLKPLVEISRKKAIKIGLRNVEFRQDDFTKLKSTLGFFDSAILNMGTISNFESKAKVIKELLRVSKVVYLDFYPPKQRGLKIRKNMYEEEKWKNVRIRGDNIVSDDGLESSSISKKQMEKIVKSINAKAKYYDFCGFSLMAEIRRA